MFPSFLLQVFQRGPSNNRTFRNLHRGPDEPDLSHSNRTRRREKGPDGHQKHAQKLAGLQQSGKLAYFMAAQQN